MRVALLGAPGSGKTKVARRMRKSLNIAEWTVIDGYVEKLEQRTGAPYTSNPLTFAHNLAVITDRWVREAEAERKGFNTITCGTIYESIMYSTFQTLFRSLNEEQLVADEVYNQIMMQALGALEVSTYAYDAMLWLPWTPEQMIAGEHTWEGVVNVQLPQLLEGYNKNVIPLLGTEKEKADRAIEVIRVLSEATTSTPDE